MIRAVVISALLLSGCSAEECRDKVARYQENLRDECRLDIRFKRCRIEIEKDAKTDRAWARVPAVFGKSVSVAAQLLCSPEYEDCLEKNGYGRINEKETCK